MTAFSNQTEEKADKPAWLEALPDETQIRLTAAVVNKPLLSGVKEGVGSAPAVAEAFTAYVNHTMNQTLTTLNPTSAANYVLAWKKFRDLVHQQFRPFDTDADGSPRKDATDRVATPGVAQTSTPTGPTGQAQTTPPPAADPAGLLKARKEAGGEATWAELKALGKTVAVMKHDKDLFSLATPTAVNLGKQFGFSSTHVANAEATTIANKNVVTVVMLADYNEAQRSELTAAVEQLTAGAKVVMRTLAGDAASKEATPTKPSKTPHPGANRVLSQEVRSKLTQYNSKFLHRADFGDTVEIRYHVGKDFSVAGKPAGELGDEVKPHQDPAPFTFRFKRLAEKKWQEVDKNPPASRRCPAGKENLKALFKAMNAKCEFQTK